MTWGADRRSLSRHCALFAAFGALASLGCADSGAEDGGRSGGGSGGTGASSGSSMGGSSTGGSATGGSVTGGLGGSAGAAAAAGRAAGGAAGAPVLDPCSLADPDGCPSGYTCACGGPGVGQCLCRKQCTEDSECGTGVLTCGCDTVAGEPAYCVDACFCLCD